MLGLAIWKRIVTGLTLLYVKYKQVDHTESLFYKFVLAIWKNNSGIMRLDFAYTVMFILLLHLII